MASRICRSGGGGRGRGETTCRGVVTSVYALAYTICHACGMMDIFRRSPQEMRSYANTVISICAEHDFPFWAAGGRILDGWAIVCQGKVDEGIEKLNEGLAAWRRTGARLWLPIFLALRAEAHAKVGRSDTALNTIEEALAISDETGERWAVAEVCGSRRACCRRPDAPQPTKSRTCSSRAWKLHGASRPFPGSCVRRATSCASGRVKVAAMKP